MNEQKLVSYEIKQMFQLSHNDVYFLQIMYKVPGDKDNYKSTHLINLHNH